MKKHKALINNLSKETELLESLDWNEEHLKSLYEYLEIHFSGDSIITPDILLEEIKNHYGKECSKVLREMFIEVSLRNGLHIYDPDVEN
tara:strand:- start:1949 stop:2215 length:267 start_codon:yes stop_codon:yes gene_type:complete